MWTLNGKEGICLLGTKVDCNLNSSAVVPAVAIGLRQFDRVPFNGADSLLWSSYVCGHEN